VSGSRDVTDTSRQGEVSDRVASEVIEGSGHPPMSHAVSDEGAIGLFAEAKREAEGRVRCSPI
jgi:hypothetical protein